MASPVSTLTNRPGRARMFVSLCRRLSSAISGVKQSPARMPRNLLAVMLMPMPLPQIRIPRSNSPAATRPATAAPKSG